jgi:CheY-like chemotaxis protein
MTKILLVEDSKFLRLATERALARAGYEMTSAADGEEALRLAREKLPDLILLDMLLPKVSGPDVLKALKEDALTKAIPVVVMTGLSQKNAARLQGDGAFGFLEKSALELEKGSGKLLAAVGGDSRQASARRAGDDGIGLRHRGPANSSIPSGTLTSRLNGICPPSGFRNLPE